jgi:small subunit ribosomal protein S16
MLKIRLQRTGRTNDPSYRVVVTEHTNGPKAGKPTDTVGSYNPKTKERVLDADRITYWFSKGVQASGTVHNMLISAGITSGKKMNVLPKKTVPKKEEEAAAPATEAPAEAPKAEEAAQNEAAPEGAEASAQA